MFITTPSKKSPCDIIRLCPRSFSMRNNRDMLFWNALEFGWIWEMRNCHMSKKRLITVSNPYCVLPTTIIIEASYIGWVVVVQNPNDVAPKFGSVSLDYLTQLALVGTPYWLYDQVVKIITTLTITVTKENNHDDFYNWLDFKCILRSKFLGNLPYCRLSLML